MIRLFKLILYRRTFAVMNALVAILVICGACEREINEFDERLDGLQIDELLRSVPNLEEPLPAYDISPGQVGDRTAESGSSFSCSSTDIARLDLLETFTVAAFNDPRLTNDKSLYPGSLIYTKDLKESNLLNSLDSVGRAPLIVANTEGTRAVVENPLFRENVEAAIQDTDLRSSPSDLSYQVTELHSAQQALTDLEINERSLGSHTGQFLRASQDIGQKSVLVKFVQNHYTIGIPTPERPSNFFGNDVTVESLQHKISPDNPLGYIKEVTFGRIILGKLTYQGPYFHESDSLAAAVESSLSAISRGSNSGIPHENELENAVFEAIMVGGSAQDIAYLSSTNGTQALKNAYKFLQEGRNSPQLALPIQFKVSYISDNTPFRIDQSSAYQVDDCVPIPRGIKISQLSLLTFPPLDDDDRWDTEDEGSGSDPDIYPVFSLNNQPVAVFSQIAFTDLTVGQLPKSYTNTSGSDILIEIGDLRKNFQLEFWDKDDTEDQFMGKIKVDWNDYHVRSDNPTPPQIEVSQEGFRVSLQLEWVY